MIRKILLTGGAGFIGSQICLELLRENKKSDISYQPIIVDNLSNSSLDSIKKIEDHFDIKIPFYQINLCDLDQLRRLFVDEEIDSVIHLAGLKSVKKSIENPREYYHNNVKGTKNLVKCMQEFEVKDLIFSSSACVYGEPKVEEIPLTEKSKLHPINPYGQSKLIVEGHLNRISNEWKTANFISLRYFNPIGADSELMIGEKPNGVPENLLPYIIKVIKGEIPELSVFGGDYPTADGTAIRDYIHIVDLAQAHIKALEYLRSRESREYDYFNVGTGQGYSVLDVIKSFDTLGVKVNYKVVDRREGDAAMVYADVTKAKEILGWKASKNLQDMIQDVKDFTNVIQE